MKSGNKTLYGMEDTERYFSISWGTMVFLASLTGDSIILIGTIKYNAIRQHKMIVAVIQHLAASDLLQTAFRVFPCSLALITDRWILGEMLCHVEENIGFVCAGVTLFLTSCMSTLKLINVKQPLRTRVWTTKLGHMIHQK